MQQVQNKRENTINAVNHDNDLQNGTQKQVKLWARLGNPWILPGRNNGSAEADPLIPEREEEYVGGRGWVTAWRASVRIDTSADDTGGFTFLPQTPRRHQEMTRHSTRPECDFWHFLHVLSRFWSLPPPRQRRPRRHRPATSGKNQVQFNTTRQIRP